MEEKSPGTDREQDKKLPGMGRQFLLTVLLTTLIAMTAVGAAWYFIERQAGTGELAAVCNQAAHILSRSLGPALGQDKDKAVVIVEAVMRDKRCVAVAVDDKTGKGSFGLLRTPKGKLTGLTTSKVDAFTSSHMPMVTPDGTELGTVAVYYTDKYLNIRLNKFAFRMIFGFVAIFITLWVTLKACVKNLAIVPLDKLNSGLIRFITGRYDPMVAKAQCAEIRQVMDSANELARILRTSGKQALSMEESAQTNLANACSMASGIHEQVLDINQLTMDMKQQAVELAEDSRQISDMVESTLDRAENCPGTGVSGHAHTQGENGSGTISTLAEKAATLSKTILDKGRDMEIMAVNASLELSKPDSGPRMESTLASMQAAAKEIGQACGQLDQLVSLEANSAPQAPASPTEHEKSACPGIVLDNLRSLLLATNKQASTAGKLNDAMAELVSGIGNIEQNSSAEKEILAEMTGVEDRGEE